MTANLDHLMMKTSSDGLIEVTNEGPMQSHKDNRSHAFDPGFGDDGMLEIGFDGKVRKDPGAVTFNPSDFKSALPGKILSTVTDRQGHAISDMSKISDDSLVSYGGTQMEVRTALRMGLLIKDGQGSYQDPTASSVDPASMNGVGNNQNEVTEKVGGPETRAVDLSGEARGNLHEIESKIGPTAMNSAVASIINSTVTGQPVDKIIADMEQSSGIVPGTLAPVLQNVLDNLEANALSFGTNQLGLPMDDMMGHLDKCSKTFQASWFHRLYLNDLTAYKELHQMWKIGQKY